METERVLKESERAFLEEELGQLLEVTLRLEAELESVRKN